ncbi:MAG: acyltransferase [Bacteroidales bacterium]|nr:acyltransferase [Bacteroidales bacterium]
MGLLRTFLKTNIFYTLWFNFKMLPFKQAVKLPFFIYGQMTMRSKKGKIVLDTNGEIHPGMVKIGKNDYYIATSVQRTIWNIRGTLVIQGNTRFMMGSYLLIADNATLTIGGNEEIFGTNLRILCFEQITLGKNVRIAWDAQIMDSSFHYIEQIEKDNAIPKLTEPIILGDNIWVGNRTTISKGAKIASWTVVASNSLVNKDFSNCEPYCLLAGAPAKVKATGLRRIFDVQREKELDAQYHYTRTHL